MVYCQKCGSKIGEGIKFCPKCGAKSGVGTSSQNIKNEPSPVAAAVPQKPLIVRIAYFLITMLVIYLIGRLVGFY